MTLPDLGQAVVINNLARQVPETVPGVQTLESNLETIGFKVKSYKDFNAQVKTYFYRLQRSCGKVMFLHLSVILFMGGVSVKRGSLSGRPPPATVVRLRAGGTHPTVMHSPCKNPFIKLLNLGSTFTCNPLNQL